jgi:hypothetical protein
MATEARRVQRPLEIGVKVFINVLLKVIGGNWCVS